MTFGREAFGLKGSLRLQHRLPAAPSPSSTVSQQHRLPAAPSPSTVSQHRLPAPSPSTVSQHRLPAPSPRHVILNLIQDPFPRYSPEKTPRWDHLLLCHSSIFGLQHPRLNDVILSGATASSRCGVLTRAQRLTNVMSNNLPRTGQGRWFASSC